MRSFGKRGMPIGSFTSQPIGNFSTSTLDHMAKQVLRMKMYLRYCDDTVGGAKTKAEAKRQLRAFNDAAEDLGLVVKMSAVVAPIGIEKRNERKKNRKRKRSHRSNNRLSGVSIHRSAGEA